MRLLLDTHILLWRLVDSTRIGADALTLMDEQADALFASAASVWEVAIKYALRRGSANDMPISGRAFLSALHDVGIDVLPIKADHAAAIENLPPVHADPFDRMLLAQARAEKMDLLTVDARLAAYGANVRLI